MSDEVFDSPELACAITAYKFQGASFSTQMSPFMNLEVSTADCWYAGLTTSRTTFILGSLSIKIATVEAEPRFTTRRMTLGQLLRDMGQVHV